MLACFCSFFSISWVLFGITPIGGLRYMTQWLTIEERIEICGIINKLQKLGIPYTKNICKCYYHSQDKEAILEMKLDLRKMRNVYDIYNSAYHGIYGWTLTKNGQQLAKQSEITWIDISAQLPEYDYKILKFLPWDDPYYTGKYERYLENQDYWKEFNWEAYNEGRIRTFEYMIKNKVKLLSREIIEYTRYITYEDSILNDIDEHGKTTPLNQLLDRYPKGYGTEGDTYQSEDDQEDDNDNGSYDSIYETAKA